MDCELLRRESAQLSNKPVGPALKFLSDYKLELFLSRSEFNSSAALVL